MRAASRLAMFDLVTRNVFAVASILLGWTAVAHAELGAMFGVRSVSLVGETEGDSRFTYAGAGVAMFTLPHGFAIGTEPGVSLSAPRPRALGSAHPASAAGSPKAASLTSIARHARGDR